MSQTSKNACPSCKVQFRTGGLLPQAEVARLTKIGIIDLGDPPETIDCPKCRAKLKVVQVQMGTFFRLDGK